MYRCSQRAGVLKLKLIIIINYIMYYIYIYVFYILHKKKKKASDSRVRTSTVDARAEEDGIVTARKTKHKHYYHIIINRFSCFPFHSVVIDCCPSSPTNKTFEPPLRSSAVKSPFIPSSTSPTTTVFSLSCVCPPIGRRKHKRRQHKTLRERSACCLYGMIQWL